MSKCEKFMTQHRFRDPSGVRGRAAHSRRRGLLRRRRGRRPQGTVLLDRIGSSCYLLSIIVDSHYAIIMCHLYVHHILPVVRRARRRRMQTMTLGPGLFRPRFYEVSQPYSSNVRATTYLMGALDELHLSCVYI